MKLNTKEPLLAEIPVPMHEQSEFFKVTIERDGVPDDPDIQGSLRGIDKVDNHLKRINDVRSKIMSDRTLNDAAKKAEYLKFVKKLEPQIQADIENVTRIVDRKTEQIHETITRPISEEAGGRFAAEIRSHVGSMKSWGDRFKFVKKRIDSGDFESASAVLGSHFYLAGLSEENQKDLLDYYREKRFADQMKIHKVMNKVGDSMMHKITMLDRFKKKLSGKETVAALQSQMARESAINE